MVDRVEAGEQVTITRYCDPVAEMSPLPRRRLNTDQLVELFKRVGQVDPDRLRRDIDGLIDQSL